MALPVININVDYESEKRKVMVLSAVVECLTRYTEKISQFLSSFEGQDGDLANGIADLDLDGDGDATRLRGKYMRQLASTTYAYFLMTVCYMDYAATNSKSRPADACDRPGGYYRRESLLWRNSELNVI